MDDDSNKDCDINKLTENLINDLQSANDLDSDTEDSDYQVSEEEDNTNS